MNNDIESIFVKSFVQKSKRERTIYELNHKSKRYSCIRNLEFTIPREYMFFPNLSSDSSDMCNYLKSNRIPDICYVMSLNTTYDGHFYKIDDIFNTEIIKYIHCILCIPDKLVYLIGEGPRGIVISK